ncbi:MAG: TerB N-terminal domain-containing protein [Oscillospiraceae bacterium]|nr:TerB N-terminal domain-containing protein [Oscillospiraceae bacterium]
MISLASLMKEMLQNAFDSMFEEEFIPARKTTAHKKTSASSGSSSGTAKSTPRKTAKTTASGKAVKSQETYYEQPLNGNPLSMFTVPSRIRKMRTLSGFNQLDGTRSMESLFYQQGIFMADYTDDFPDMVQCSRSTPMYYNMKDDELRAYFTWRTRYRQGALPAAQSAFLLLYTFEILNLIGVSAPEEGYGILCRLREDYGESFPAFQKSLDMWMQDFAAYYRLPYRLLNEKEAAVITVLRHSTSSPEEFITAIDRLSKYHLKDSKLYLAETEMVSVLLKKVFNAFLIQYAEKKHQSFAAQLLGNQKRFQHVMFEGAVFYYRTPMNDGAYRLSPICVYHYFQGTWAKEVFCSQPDQDAIGAFLRSFDSILREEIHFRNKLKAGTLSETDLAFMRQVIRQHFEEEKRANAPKITLDSAELEAIRKAADHTTDMLTIPEEEMEETILLPAPETAAAEQIQAEGQTDGNHSLPDLPLSKPAMVLLLCLLTGESYQPLIDAGHMLSVLAEEINEQLYDRIGDSVIETDENGTPVLIEDYIEDLKGILET